MTLLGAGALHDVAERAMTLLGAGARYDVAERAMTCWVLARVMMIQSER